MISVVIPTSNAAATLPATLRSLLEAAIDGLVSEVIVSDCGSADATAKIADSAGANVIQAGPGQQLLAAAKAARKAWLLFLKPGSTMEPGWEEEARTFMVEGEESAAAFRLRLAAKGLRPWLRETLAAMEPRTFRLNSSCDGLLIRAKLLDAACTGSTPQAEEAGLMRRLDRDGICFLKAAVIAGPARTGGRH